MKRFLMIGGLVLVLLGALYGAGYGGFFLPGVKHKQNELLKNAIKISSESATIAEKEADLYINKMLYDHRMGSVHSHMTLIGILSLVMAHILSIFRLSKVWAWMACVSLLMGGVILPLGVFLESWTAKIGGFTAMLGGTSLIIALIIFLVGLLRANKSKFKY